MSGRRSPSAAPSAVVTAAVTAVVTGAGGGIGRAIVGELLERGLRVVATDSEPGSLETLTGPAERLCRRQMDVTDLSAIRRTADELHQTHGGVDVLVNNAGVFRRTPCLEADEEAMRLVLDVNLLGSLRCTAAFGHLMSEQRSGRIINVASISGISGAAFASVYAASKAGIIAATRCAARELADHGVVVNAVLPGYCDTPMLDGQRGLVERLVVPRIPARRVGRPEEVAELVGFLATCRTDYMTGSLLTIDGGIHAG